MQQAATNAKFGSVLLTKVFIPKTSTVMIQAIAQLMLVIQQLDNAHTLQ
jgi:hypothetical protein